MNEYRVIVALSFRPVHSKDGTEFVLDALGRNVTFRESISPSGNLCVIQVNWTEVTAVEDMCRETNTGQRLGEFVRSAVATGIFHVDIFVQVEKCDSGYSLSLNRKTLELMYHVEADWHFNWVEEPSGQ